MTGAYSYFDFFFFLFLGGGGGNITSVNGYILVGVSERSLMKPISALGY